MKTTYEVTDTEGIQYTVKLEMIHDGNEFYPYGIRASIFQNDSLTESAEAKARFLTPDEAQAAMEMLCRFQVTPCTLCDVI
ncbi:DUF6514 family protein [Ructibacterium gallinarum]|uniref:Uncharacterized protein n=1 Tax=Ructibacterium gallinarum TaxID=2779355 RepID=A0A9D5R8M5_9FIRM|nr:hypothetical protein [Ructibacterium gallinarum]MBE5040122.1 hypothetical protein [Ructibacterium gallinarum]